MKRRIITISLHTGIALLFGTSLFAQTEEQQRTIAAGTNVEKLKELASEYGKTFHENYAKALQMAEQKGWRITFVDENGSEHELQGVSEEGLPIYNKTLNQGSAVTARVDKINSGGSLGLNLNGQDMRVGVWDQNHPRLTHLDFEGRGIVTDASATAESFHSTHVLGTIISSGANNSAGRGLAYQANAWVNNWTNDIDEMAMLASSGLLVSNHSYSSAPNPIPEYYFGSYRENARDVDNVMFNAPYYQVVIAAGNDRNSGLNPSKDGNDLLYSKGTSKNGIVVAAVNQVTNYTGPESVSMSGFSSYGPTDDFRIKPDISAKGVGVLSTSNTNNTSYGSSQGTSMAAPAVSAAILLLQQHYGNLYGTFSQPYMRSATLRGLVIHTASEAGTAPGPDHRFGWGLIDAGKAAQVLSGRGTSSIIKEYTLTQGQPYTTEVVATGNEPIVVTICWTDRPGSVSPSTVDFSSPKLINDLDVRVTRNGTTYFPWTLTKNFSNPAAVKADNNVDNVEKIEISNPEAGDQYVITVSNKGSLVGGSQDYSLIVTGVDATLSSNNFSTKGEVKVYPNPTNDILNVAMSDFEGEAVISLYDIRGAKLMSENKYISGETIVDISSYANGMYFLIVDTPQGKFTQKVYKK
jgi:serine protease AprX